MITIDGVQYDLASLSDDARAQLLHLQYCDRQLAELEVKQAVLKTARLAYSRTLSEMLSSQ